MLDAWLGRWTVSVGSIRYAYWRDADCIRQSGGAHSQAVRIPIGDGHVSLLPADFVRFTRRYRSDLCVLGLPLRLGLLGVCPHPFLRGTH